MGDVQSVGKWLGPQQDVSFCGKFLDMFLPAILCVLHPSSARIPESFSYSQRSVAICALDGVYIAPNAKASLMHASKQWLLPSECRVRHRYRQRVIFRDNAG
ncbi:hypothetical protein CIHG_03216 [Coccidioides immitis H538.4]|uniref:Uncharacterized protein n=1 Tax=Coccidioides immitis H538.4 TaxID=396776 RepID=A0A0J8RN66_COCIT|nr:hypothetical protein CIHG_03216 [Coccidioides immitis H538.4]